MNISAFNSGLNQYERISGVYFMTLRSGRVVYVGSSRDIGRRVGNHHINRKAYSRVYYIEVGSEREIVERVFISIFQPKLNFIEGELLAFDYEESWLDRVVEEYFGNRWDLLPSREAILSCRLREVRARMAYVPPERVIQYGLPATRELIEKMIAGRLGWTPQHVIDRCYYEGGEPGKRFRHESWCLILNRRIVNILRMKRGGRLAIEPVTKFAWRVIPSPSSHHPSSASPSAPEAAEVRQ